MLLEKGSVLLQDNGIDGNVLCEMTDAPRIVDRSSEL